MSFFAKKAATFLQRTGCEKRKWPEQGGGGRLSACQEWLYRKPCELLLCWILLNKRGNQEKSDKQKNGATKTARTGWWLVSAGSPLFTSSRGGFEQVVRVGPLWPSSCMSLYPPLQSMLCRVKSMRLGQLGNGPLSPVSGQFCESNNTSVEIKVLLRRTHIKWTEDLMEVSNSIQTQVRVVRTAPGQGSGQLAGLSFAEFHLDWPKQGKVVNKLQIRSFGPKQRPS